MTDPRTRADELLRALAGPDARLRDDQWTAIEALVVGRRRALVVQRTGWGKSAVYFIATALLREQGAGATVIVSPLLALMRNQIDAASRAGIRAHTINSANLEEWDEVEAAVHRGETDVLLVSPERLNNPGFRDTVLPRLAKETGLLVIDEAHCISDWGHDFRPDYRRIRTLLADLPAGIPVLATTATANARVVDDVADQLTTGNRHMSAIDGRHVAIEGPVVLRGSLDRESLHLGVVQLPSNAHRLGWLAEHLDELDGSGIVYALTVAQAEAVAAFLRGHGHDVVSYTGRTETADRLAAEQDLVDNKVKALVATSALGMGFDKPDLGFVLHLGAPQSPVAYYQQVGRAGRGVDKATVLLLPGTEDEDVWRYFSSVGFPPEDVVRRTLDVLAASGKPTSVPALEVQVELSRSRLEQMLKVLDVDGAVRRVQGGWLATGEPWTYDAERYAKVAAVRAAEQQAMRDYIAADGCRMEFLRRQLDDPGAQPCGRCDNCTGTRWSTQVSETTVKESRAEMLRPGVEVEPRAMWPTGLATIGVPLSGRIPAEERAATGRAIGRLSDIGWGPRLRRVLHESAADGPLPDELFNAAVEVLRTWGWEQRPAAVLAVPSATRPVLVTTLGERLAAIGRLEWLGPLAFSRDAATSTAAASRTNSAQRVRVLHDAFAVTPEQASALRRLDGPVVLLVDDLVDSGWTMALAARQLRLAGAADVLPFALGVDG
ncbi:MAG TPA: DEAD/DEAH box helicase [Mycobacteriales bacterium]|nr:DEAD/DEAH box helicase [Mycobacteriales bacterium]